MDYRKKCRQVANSYYNLGLEKAKIRDLTGAADCLKKSLHFNKAHTDARNLLGLIYYEIGETADALVQWVISMSLQPEKNRADHYLDEIQRKPGRLETASQNVKKYNQALWHAQTGSDDLAVLQLTRIVESNPNFVKAHLLLSLLYMAHSDYTKAGKSLFKVLQIDKNNPKALWYMSIVKANTGRAEIEKKKLKNAFSHRQMQDDDIIIPPTYKENTGWQTIINILVGLCLGTAVIFFLIMPASTKAINIEHNKEMQVYLEQINSKNLELTRMESTVEEYKRQKEEAEASLQSVMNDNGGILNQYQTLIGILQAYKTDDFTTAVKLYANLDPTVITEAAVQAVIAEIKADMDANGYQELQKLGEEAAAAGNQTEALDYYHKSLVIHPDNPQVIFNMAVIYKGLGDMENANKLFGDVIMNYSNTDLAEQAKTERGY
ncbi:MAG: hypothetical protein KH366_22940 [Clostridiaceae bacterium]|nr:hypothetical protein [Clostridiaceae bacterium]